MLERIREGATGLWAKIILGLVILSFMFAGVGSYISSSADNPAATVNGEAIATSTFERAYQNERSRMESQLGDAFAQLASNSEYLRGFRNDVLDRLVDDVLLNQKASELGLRVSDGQLRQTLLEMPEFQVAGQFSNDRFQALIRQAGFSPAEFRDYLRTELTRQQFSRALALTDFALPGEAESFVKIQKQTRSGRYVTIPQSLFADDIEITDAERSDYYINNISDFDTPERVKVAYVELQVDDLLPEMQVDADEVADYYQSNLNSYRAEEERRASHILVEFGEDEAQGLAKAEGLLQQLADGADFAELAQSSSDDTFSAEIGGDLDWFGRGVMDPEFEQAAFSLANVGDVSDVVRSEFGFHIIKLTDVKAEQVQPLKDVTADIETFLKREKAIERYLELQQEMAALAFEMPEGLDEVAAVINDEVQVTELFSRNEAPQALASPMILNEVFSIELIEDQVNSDVIELGDDHLIIVRVEQHEPQRTQSQDEVVEQIDAALGQEKAKAAALAWAEELSSQLLEDPSAVAAALAEKELEWTEVEDSERFGSAMPREVATELFKLSAAEEPATVELFAGDIALLQLTNITDVEAVDSAERTAAQQRLASNSGQISFAAIVAALNASSEVETGLN